MDEAAEAATIAQRNLRSPRPAEPRWSPAGHARTTAPGQRAEADKAHAESLKALAGAEQESPVSRRARATRPPRRTTYPATSTGRRLAFARLDHRPVQPADGPGGRQSSVGPSFRPGDRSVGQRLRPQRPAAVASGLARLAGGRIHGTRLEHEGDPPPDRHQRRPTARIRGRTPADLARDPDNVFLWRWTPRRAEAEVVRDCLFAVAGSLDSRMGGPPSTIKAGLTVPRRSLYFQHAAEKQMEFLQIFDGAGVTECYRRKESILPQQALALANSDLSLRQARRLARALSNERRLRFREFRDGRIRAGARSWPDRSGTARVPCVSRTGCRVGQCGCRTGRTPEDPGGKAPATDPALSAAKAWSTCS